MDIDMNNIPELGLILLAIAVWSVWREYFSWRSGDWTVTGVTGCRTVIAHDPATGVSIIAPDDGEWRIVGLNEDEAIRTAPLADVVSFIEENPPANPNSDDIDEVIEAYLDAVQRRPLSYYFKREENK